MEAKEDWRKWRGYGQLFDNYFEQTFRIFIVEEERIVQIDNSSSNDA